MIYSLIVLTAGFFCFSERSGLVCRWSIFTGKYFSCFSISYWIDDLCDGNQFARGSCFISSRVKRKFRNYREKE